MAHKTTFLAGLIFLLSSLLFAQGELYGPVYIIGDDGRLYIDHIPDTITASYLAVIDDGWLKKLDIDNLDLDTSNIAGLYDYLNAKSDTGHVHDTSDVTGLHNMLAGKLDVSDTSDLARKIHDHTISDVAGLQDALELKLDVTDTSVFVRDPELDDYYTKTDLQTSGQSSVHWGNLTNKPTVFPPESHNHSASDINSGTLSDSRLSNNVFSKKTDIPGGADLNNYTNIGFYHQNMNSYAQSGTNYPVGLAGMLEVQSDGLMVYQRYTVHNTGEIHTRSSYQGTWNVWNKVWDNGNLDPSDYALVSHNHSASDINSGTLSDSRLSFNPDYFVQGENSSRAITYSISNPFDGTNNVSTFFRLNRDEPSNPTGLEPYYGFRCVNPDNDKYTTEIAGRAQTGELYFGGLQGSIRQPWREIWHSGNLDTANIARRNVDNVFTGVNTFSDTVGIKNGIKISDNSNHFFAIGQDLHGEAGNEPPSIKFYLKDYSSGYPNTSEQSIKVEADWIRNFADYQISNSAKHIVNGGLSTFSDDHIGGGVSNPVHIRNNYSIDSTGAQITFGFHGSVAPSDWHHAGIKAMRTNKGADHASSIYLQARAPGTSSGPSGLTDIVEAGINDHQAFVKYHNNPSIIHSEYGIISSSPNSQTLNPTKGVYICGGSTLGLEIILDTTGVENGQTVKILKSSNLLARVRYGAPGNYQWRAIGHSGAAEFIHYNGEWFCLGAEWKY